MDTNSYYEAVGDYQPFVPAQAAVAVNHEHAAPTTRVTEAEPIEFGSGWYHDAAIQDAKDAQAHPYR